MAPRDIEQQTLAIISCLFDDDTAVFRSNDSQDSGSIEPDGVDDFDPVPLAEKLKEIGDQMMDDPMFQGVKSQLLSATAEHVVSEVFSKNVEAMCRAQPAPDMAPEIQMTRTAVALGYALKKALPHLGTALQNTLISFINRNVGSDSLAQRGGWDAVANAPGPQQ